jgi:hypothetical protein
MKIYAKMTSRLKLYWLVLILALFVVTQSSSSGAKYKKNAPVVFKRLSPIEIDENVAIGQLIVDLKVLSI